MSARDVIAEAVWLLDREIAGAPLPAPAWATFKENDPETAAIYETQAGCHLSALSAAGYAVERGWQPIETAPRDGTLVLCWAPAVVGDYPQPVQRLDRWEGKYAGFGWMRPGQSYTHWRPLPAAPEARDDA